MLLFVAHTLLGIAMRSSTTIATVHAGFVAVATIVILFRPVSIDAMLGLMGYSLACTVLWRVTGASTLWFFPEYLCMLILLAGIRRLPTVRTGIKSGFLFLALLLPSTLLTLFYSEFGWARQQIAYVLLPHALAATSIFFFSRLAIERRSILVMLFWSVLPILASWGISANNVYVIGVHYGLSSNNFASGGAAPNQVSTLFSFGAVALIAAIMLSRLPLATRVVFLLTAVALVAQSIMTFSRGGVYNLIGYFGLAIPFSLADKKRRLQFLVVGALVVYPFVTYLVPALDTFTKGALEARYEREGSTGRDNLALQDVEIFMDNPILGVGPGMGRELRTWGREQGINAHTEYTRILAEHGLFGIAALIVMLLTFFKIFNTSVYNWQRGIVAGLIGWPMMMFVHAATRISIFVVFLIAATALAYFREPEEETEDDVETRVPAPPQWSGNGR